MMYETANPALLGVNIDHVATLRNARGMGYPNPVHAAGIAERAGADCITVHLREDRRHINDRDVKALKGTIQTRMNLEIAATSGMISLALEIQPDFVCLVPERRQELTTEGGLDVVRQLDKIKSATKRLRDANINVSLFIDADCEQVDAAQACKASCVELHTGHYANAGSSEERLEELKRVRVVARRAYELGMTVNAGHGLTYHNVTAIASLPEIYELNIGHSIIGRAIFDGLSDAVKDMKRMIFEARNYS